MAMANNIAPIFPTIVLSADEIADVRYNATRSIWNGYVEDVYASDGTFQRTDTWVSVSTEQCGEMVAKYVGTDYIIEGDEEALGFDLYIPDFHIGNAHGGTCVIAGATLKEVLEKLDSFSDT